jgi:hypothetical protein
MLVEKLVVQIVVEKLVVQMVVEKLEVQMVVEKLVVHVLAKLVVYVVAKMVVHVMAGLVVHLVEKLVIQMVALPHCRTVWVARAPRRRMLRKQGVSANQRKLMYTTRSHSVSLTFLMIAQYFFARRFIGTKIFVKGK